MNDEQKVAYIQAQTVCALAEIEAMKAENAYREMQGLTIAYDEKAFLKIQDEYCISHNAVIQLFHDLP